jgi:hypothetical protein
MIVEEYRGYNLTAVRRNEMWEVSIYPLSWVKLSPSPEAGKPLRPSHGKMLLSKHVGALMPC